MTIKLNTYFVEVGLKIVKDLMFIILLLILVNSQLFASPSVDTLAIVGNKVISVKDFIEKFNEKKNRLGIGDNLEIRTNYLINIISDELIIADAKSKGMHKTEESINELKRIEIQELLNAYTQKHISPSIEIHEDELKDLFIKINTRLNVSHLYAPSQDIAKSLAEELKNGKSFESLASQIFADPVLRKNGGSLGYISIDEMDPDFENVAYSLKVGEISNPVKTVRGYSIIKLNGILKNPLVTENEYLKVRNRLKALARKRKFESIVKQYSNDISRELIIEINSEMITQLYNSLKVTPDNENIENSIFLNSNDRNRNVLSSTIGNWSLNTLINEMKLTTPKMRGWIRTEENLKDYISGLVARRYLVDKAYSEKLDTAFIVKKNIKYEFDTYLLTKSEEQLKNKIKVTSDIVNEYYQKNKNLFWIEPEIRLSSILISNLPMVETVKDMLENGVEFETLAEKYSDQSQTAIKGGDMGFFKKSDLDFLGDTLFTLKKGQWDGPFLSNNKHVFIKCTETKNAEYMSLEEAADQIKENLISMKFYEVREKYVESLKQEIKLATYFDKLKKLKL